MILCVWEGRVDYCLLSIVRLARDKNIIKVYYYPVDTLQEALDYPLKYARHRGNAKRQPHIAEQPTVSVNHYVFL